MYQAIGLNGLDKSRVISALIGGIAVILAAVLPLYLSFDKKQAEFDAKLSELEERNQELQDMLDSLRVRFSHLMAIPDDSIIWAKNGHRYYVSDELYTWSNARAYCEFLGGHLATITSQEEQEFIQKTLLAAGKRDSYWLGASDADEEGHWEWVTGEAWRNPNWRYEEPSNDDMNGEPENYLMMYHTGTDIDGSWNDYRDKIANIGYICEWDAAVQAAG